MLIYIFCRGQTALHQAASSRCRTVCCMLVAAGASLAKKDSDGNPPRILAQKALDHELAAYLESKSKMVNLREAMLSAHMKARDAEMKSTSSDDDSLSASKIIPQTASSPTSGSPTLLKEGFVSSGTQTFITLTTYSAACAQALSKALVEALTEEEARLRLLAKEDQFQTLNKRLKIERLI